MRIGSIGKNGIATVKAATEEVITARKALVGAKRAGEETYSYAIKAGEETYAKSAGEETYRVMA